MMKVSEIVIFMVQLNWKKRAERTSASEKKSKPIDMGKGSKIT